MARVSLKSFHGAGKTRCAALAAIWFFMTRKDAIVIITAPVEQQVKDRIFGEIAKLVKQSNFYQQLAKGLTTMRLEMPGHGEYWFIQGRVSNKPVNVEGYHAPNILFIVDEAKGVPYSVFQAFEGALTNAEGDVRVLLISTPSINPSGYFYDTWKSKRMNGMYKLVNVGLNDTKRVSPEWRAARAREWGENSPVYQARVLGEFPDNAEGTLYPAQLVEPAVEREMEPTTPIAVGADIARFGEDKTVFFVRRGGVLSEPIVYEKQDTMTTATALRMLALQVGATVINIDDGGLGGGVTDRLIQLKNTYRDPWTVNPIDMGSSPLTQPFNSQKNDHPVRYLNLKAELAWHFRQLLEEGKVSLPDNGTLLADLLSYQYDYNSKDLIRLESKQKHKDRIGRSPDYGDACILAFYEPPLTGAPKFSYYDDETDRVVTV